MYYNMVKRKPTRKAEQRYFANKNKKQLTGLQVGIEAEKKKKRLTSSRVGIEATVGILPSIKFIYNRSYKYNQT